jgi:hypothetical protein
MWKAIIYATSDEHYEVVREFLRRNDVAVHALRLDLLAKELPVADEGR